MTLMNIGEGTGPWSYISLLERAGSNVTVEKLEQVAAALEINPLTLLLLAQSAQRGVMPDALVNELLSEIRALDVEAELQQIAVHLAKGTTPVREHSRAKEGKATTAAVLELKQQGKTQAEVSRALGLARSSVSKHWRRD
ncbi:helix-turn-helix domain-containing protein [Pseudomonas sp. CCI1.2]|uniref:helix-turn-helix domain-containing protein n=1 Tax=Pseudomonas sp. CCI1.2 TaxID=3048614 RepID=UPI002B22CEDA|nr:helix-turn-helix domain-containing protein [Pseudomonas sp. CCI1.2]MEB0123474.1 helix-turn-helix domain-containing protein [Pseudomonas sp. CCI1.2]